MEGTNGVSRSGSPEEAEQTSALSGPVEPETGERMKSEQEVIAIAISGVAHPDEAWMELAPEQREVYMEMAEEAVKAAMPPLPKHENEPDDPPYPAELLDLLATQLAHKYLNPGQFFEGVRDAFDRYSLEVGRDNVPAVVAEAIAKL